MAMFASAAAMLIVALATPEAFGVEALVFGVAYFFVRALHIVLYAHRQRRRPRAACGRPPDSSPAPCSDRRCW